MLPTELEALRLYRLQLQGLQALPWHADSRSNCRHFERFMNRQSPLYDTYAIRQSLTGTTAVPRLHVRPTSAGITPQFYAEISVLCHDTSGSQSAARECITTGPFCAKNSKELLRCQAAVQVPIGGKLVDLAPRKLASPYLTALLVCIESLPSGGP